MTSHVYSIGQKVSFDRRIGTYLKRAGVFTITKLLPPSGADCNIASRVMVKPTNASQASMNSCRGVGTADHCGGIEIVEGEANAARLFAGLS